MHMSPIDLDYKEEYFNGGEHENGRKIQKTNWIKEKRSPNLAREPGNSPKKFAQVARI